MIPALYIPSLWIGQGQEETGEQLLLVRQRMHQGLQHGLHQLLRVQQGRGRHRCHGANLGKIISHQNGVHAEGGGRIGGPAKRIETALVKLK